MNEMKAFVSPDMDVPGKVWSLRDYWFILMNHRGVMVATTLSALFLAGVLALTQKPIYRATALLEVRPERLNIGEQLYERLGYYDPLETFLSTQMGIARSPAVAQGVLDRLGSDKVIQYLGLEKPNGRNWSREALLNAMVERVVTIRPSRDTFLLELGVEAPSPEASAALTNAWAEAWVESDRNAEAEVNQPVVQALTQEIVRLQKSIREKETRLAQLAQTAQIRVLDEQVNVLKERMDRMSDAISQAQAEVTDKRARLRLVQMAPPEALPEIRNSVHIQGLRKACMDIEQEYAEKKSVFKSDWPGLRQLATKRDEACRRYQQEVEALYQAMLRQAQTELEAAQAKEQQLRQQFEAVQAEIERLNQATTEYQTLKAELENERRFLETLTQRRQEAIIRREGTLPVKAMLRIVAPAQPPPAPIRPHRLRIMVTALLIGLGGGIGLAFLLHFLDDRIRSHEDIRSIAPYPFLTFIPDREKEGKNGEDIIANAFKTLRELIFMNQKNTLLAQSLLVTSAGPDEGKTFVAIHLALSLARAQKRVLLIEADLYRGPIARILRVPRRPGLIDLLLDSENLYAPNDFPQVNEYLTVVPHGVSDRSSSPRPERLDLQGVLARFATAFDYIIIDALPVLSMAEAVQLVSQVDGVLLVVRSDSTTRSVLRTAVELLEKVHAPVTGVVLNRVNLKSRYSYYRYYHSYYQYYSRYQIQTE